MLWIHYATQEALNTEISARISAVNSLQNQIDTIELMPGETGPQGPAGADGKTAPAGIEIGDMQYWDGT